jgi:hypothetical protein
MWSIGRNGGVGRVKKVVWIVLLIATILLAPWTFEFASILIVGTDMDIGPLDQLFLLIPILITLVCAALSVSVYRARRRASD